MVHPHGNTGPTDKEADLPPARTPRPRGRGGTLPRRPSPLRNVATPMKSGGTPVSRPQGRPNPSAGTGWSRKRMPPAERQGEDITRWIGSVDPCRKAADVDQVSHPKDVATVANPRTSSMRAPGSANGPRRPTDWNAVDWRRAQRVVRNLRQRIFRATQAGDWRKVRSLQKLMLRSRSNLVLGVRQVTQVNAGKYSTVTSN